MEQAKDIFSSAFDNVKYLGEAEDITVGGREAKQLFFTCEVSGMQMKFQYAFFFIGSDVYVATLGCLKDDFAGFSADFAQILANISFE